MTLFGSIDPQGQGWADLIWGASCTDFDPLYGVVAQGAGSDCSTVPCPFGFIGCSMAALTVLLVDLKTTADPSLQGPWKQGDLNALQEALSVEVFGV